DANESAGSHPYTLGRSVERNLPGSAAFTTLAGVGLGPAPASKSAIMGFWTREPAGWLLIVEGLFIFRQCYTLLSHPDQCFLQGSALTLIGIIVFGGGINLLKIAVAAQVCVQAQETLEQRAPAGLLPGPSRSPVRRRVF